MKNHQENNISACPGRSFRPLFFLFLFSLCGLLPACYETVEGCLDPNALNFGLDADRECDGCCNYPALSVRFVHQWVDEDTSFTIRYNEDAYQDGNGHPFRIDRITYYLKDFALLDTEGNLLFTADTVLVAQLNENGFYEDRFVRDDYLLINPAVGAALEVGTLPRNGNFTELQFELGVDEFTDRISPLSLPNNHPISLLDTSMYDLSDERYISNRLDLRRNISENADSLLLSYGAERSTIPVSISIPGGFSLPAGFNLEVAISVNYAEWFRGVQNIGTAPASTVLEQIVGSLPNSFGFLDISIDQR